MITTEDLTRVVGDENIAIIVSAIQVLNAAKEGGKAVQQSSDVIPGGRAMSKGGPGGMRDG